TPNKYEWQAEIEPVSNNTFLTVGSALNFMQLPSQTPNPNSHYWLDMAVGLRSMGNLHEIGPAYAYGKIDSSENSAVGELPFKKVENDLYYLGATSRFSGTPPEPWDTELALFALNNNGEKHWEYYLPLNDYCYIQDLHASPSGGMWFIAQCSENYNNSTGSYDYFTKVGYVDSTYYWPRIGAVGIESPRKKAEEIQVYPNPAIDKLKVKQYGLIQALKYSLYDLQGRLVLQKRVSSHLSQLDVSSLKKAMYLLRVEDEKGRLVKEVKVVK
ncbi:MAG: T9SS type A sorting domain-containing protein, partial [Vicingaceae bacterium]